MFFWTYSYLTISSVLLCCLLPGVTWGNQVRAACPKEAEVCEFYLEIKEANTMTLPVGENTQVLDIDSEGKVYKRPYGCGKRKPLDDRDISKVPFGDGSYKKVFLYNHTLPGPPLVVYEGQQVMVRLWNRMRSYGTTIHFHGQRQLNTPWMDGVSGVSQCDILPGERFTYRFLASPFGTHWYHSHYDAQRSMGAAGPLIVLERDEEVVKDRRGLSPLPEFDDDFYMLIQDWYRERSDDSLLITRFDIVKYGYNYNTDICYNSTKQIDGVDSGVLPFVSALINGKGRYNGQDVRYPTPSFAPYELYKVRQDGYYRFRVIGASLQFPLHVSIDHHPLYVIASDGHHLKTKVTDSLIVHNGERFDFYIEAKDPLNVGNYWIRVRTLEHSHDNHSIEAGHVLAILRYEGAAVRDPTTLPRTCTQDTPCQVSNCPYTTEVTARYNSTCNGITDFSQPQPQPTLEPEEGEDIQEYFLNLHFAVSDQPVDHITWGEKLGTEKPTFNGVQNRLPVTSRMTYPDNLDPTIKQCHFTSCKTGLCRTCEHIIDLPLNKVIQFNFVVTVNQTRGMKNDSNSKDLPDEDPYRKVINGNDHPIHIHGHVLQVLKIGYPTYHPVTKNYDRINEDITCITDDCNTVGWTNKSWSGGHVPGLLRHSAPRKDSFIIPLGGYVVTRFKTDNPGYWFMHCHLEFHNSEGMSLLLKVGNESQMNAKPRNMRTCSNFKWTEEDLISNSCEEYTDGDETYRTPTIILMVVVIFQLFYIIIIKKKYT